MDTLAAADALQDRLEAQSELSASGDELELVVNVIGGLLLHNAVSGDSTREKGNIHPIVSTDLRHS